MKYNYSLSYPQDELSASLRKFGVYDDAAALLSTADKNGDGMIDYVSA